MSGIVPFGVSAQNTNMTVSPNTSTSSNNGNGINNNTNTQGVPYTNPNYDHSPNYYQTPYNDPHTHYLQIEDNPAPVNNNNNNNTMTSYNNNMSPYDVTSPYYTPPNTKAPLNNTPPVR